MAGISRAVKTIIMSARRNVMGTTGAATMSVKVRPCLELDEV